MGIFGDTFVSGYNCEQVNALRDPINNTAQSSASRIVEILEEKIVVPMSKAWYAPEAVTFFEGFKTTVQSSGQAITNAFDSFRAAVQSAGANWAENTGGATPELAAIDLVELNLDISAIQPDNAGNVTINEEDASVIAFSLEMIEKEIKTELEGLAKNLNGETAFIGHGQADALQNCFVTVSGEIHKIFKYLTDGDDSLQGQIKKAVQKYKEVSEGISTAFNTSGTAQ